MPIPSIKRRLGALEAAVAWTRIPDYPPLTFIEINNIATRVHSGEMLSRVELARLERQRSITDGELLISCYRGQVIMKRYLGIDLAQV